MEIKIDASFCVLSPCADRYVLQGYRDAIPFEQQIEEMAKVEGVNGVALGYPLPYDDPAELKKRVEEVGLQVGMIEVALSYDRKWKWGTYTSNDPKLRQEAIELTKQTMDAAVEVEATDVQLWLGQDGYDYPFQVDYATTWERLVEGIREAASYRPEVKITVEYKRTEPRHRCFIDTATTAIALLDEIGLPNVGVTLDTGHSLMALENPAKAAVLLTRKNRLFHLHLNDNYKDWDQDMVFGTANIWEHVEMFYWLEKMDYQVWHGTDIFPYREDGIAALTQTVRYIYKLRELASRLLDSPLDQLREANEVNAIQELLRETILAK